MPRKSAAYLSAGALFMGGVALAAPAALPGYRISGPYTYENLSVFLIHGARANSGPKYLTLQDAMEQKKVAVYETGSVNELEIENLSSQDIYIQSGDIVKGGKQDRVFPDDFILPTASGRVPIPSFCVEHGRWTRRGAEAADRFTASTQSLPVKSLKLAARSERDQQTVWNEVAAAERKAATSVGYAGPMPSPSPTSMQLTLENSRVSEAIGAYIRELSNVVDRGGVVVGFAFAVNGKVSSADIYGSADLCRRMWPKLLRASAAEALMERRAGASFKTPGAEAVRTVLAAAGRGRESVKTAGRRVVVVTRESDDAIVFDARDGNASIHRSYIVK